MEKGFFEKTKVKIALAGAITMFVVTFIRSLLDSNGTELGEDTWAWIYATLLGLIMSLLGAHTVTDAVATKAKILSAANLTMATMKVDADSNLAMKVAKDLIAKKNGDDDPSLPSTHSPK